MKFDRLMQNNLAIVTRSVSGHLGPIVPITTVAVLRQLDNKPYCLSQDRAPVCLCVWPLGRAFSLPLCAYLMTVSGHVQLPVVVRPVRTYVIIELSCVCADVLVSCGVNQWSK